MSFEVHCTFADGTKQHSSDFDDLSAAAVYALKIADDAGFREAGIGSEHMEVVTIHQGIDVILSIMVVQGGLASDIDHLESR